MSITFDADSVSVESVGRNSQVRVTVEGKGSDIAESLHIDDRLHDLEPHEIVNHIGAGKLLETMDEAEISELEVSDESSRLDESVNTADDDAPIVKYIHKIMMDAIKRGASDLHFEPYETKYRIRFRVDGILHEVATPPVNLANRFAARLKVMARLDIAERRLPQDGRISLRLAGHEVDVRVSTLPAAHGERVVLRLLDKQAVRLDIQHMQMDIFKSVWY